MKLNIPNVETSIIFPANDECFYISVDISGKKASIQSKNLVSDHLIKNEIMTFCNDLNLKREKSIEYGDEFAINISDSYSLNFDTLFSYVRICTTENITYADSLYWTIDEIEESPTDVLGAIAGSITEYLR